MRPSTIDDLRKDWQRQLKIYDYAIDSLDQGHRQQTTLGKTHRELLQERREEMRRRLAEYPGTP